ncbi:L-lactate dehydrogenase complex protein LldG [Brevundimonas nasdae]|uniref:L-lactate dehydrogenase complex protein LldG n=1 Tax=Sphingomonas abaci TaxID=237611 RepID=A0A7W7EZY6_9SPHN|nr:LUD domain-containing protein [Brevundimonas nasdae]MBB4619609.1 L-lactate dehydrogenase complex protein LldG [Sphingomonas abaci]MBK6026954.1 LUD domain-containing protein [Brevundimonas nasdae]MDQ0453667.1 L-lactate dehydrogenase complex protein LldG [Brevundimonas nasdae]
MSARDAILAAVRANRPQGDHPLPELPIFPFAAEGGLVEPFLRNLEAMGGHGVEGGDIEGILRAQFPQANVIASAVPEYRGNRDLAQVSAPNDLADVDVAIVRAEFGVAETGSVLLPDTALTVNAVAYLAQHLVVLLAPDAIVPTLQEAYRRPEFHRHRYASFHTGPSATADIEGVLIHGAQGVRSLSVVMCPLKTGS